MHSYNDLREWPQLFHKMTSLRSSAFFFKVDANYLPSSLCAHFGLDTHAGRGCLVLNHDNPSTHVPASRRFFSPDDVLALVPDLPKPSKVYLCFKNVPDDLCNGKSEQTAWLSLVDDLMERVLATMHKFAHVEFVLDGGATPKVPCLAQRWRPLNSTFNSLSDPNGAFLHNNASLGWDRFQTLDEQYHVAPVAALFKWGKFSQGSYPLLVWEPSDEATILAIGGLYPLVNVPFSAGMRFAINIDPVQFELYASALTKRAWLASPLANTSGAVAAFSSSRGSTLILSPNVYSWADAAHQTTTAPHSIALPSAFGQSPDLNRVAIDSAGQRVVLSSSSGAFAFYAASSSGLLSLQHSGTLVPPNQQVLVSATSEFVEGTGFIQVFSNGSCLNGYEWQYAATLEPSSGLLFECLDTAFPLSTLADDGLAVSATKNSSCLYIAVSAASLNGTIYSAAFCADHGPRGGLQPFAVGQRPRLAIAAPATGPMQVVVVHAAAYCFNNDDHNKDAEQALCESKPVSTDGVLAYTIATADAFAHRSPSDTASPCSTSMAHGTFGQGSKPSIAVSPFGDLLVAHDGSQGQDAGNCGAAKPFDGVQLSSFYWSW